MSPSSPLRPALGHSAWQRRRRGLAVPALTLGIPPRPKVAGLASEGEGADLPRPRGVVAPHDGPPRGVAQTAGPQNPRHITCPCLEPRRGRVARAAGTQRRVSKRVYRSPGPSSERRPWPLSFLPFSSPFRTQLGRPLHQAAFLAPGPPHHSPCRPGPPYLLTSWPDEALTSLDRGASPVETAPICPPSRRENRNSTCDCYWGSVRVTVSLSALFPAPHPLPWGLQG